MKRECRGLEITSSRQATRTVALPGMRSLGARARSSSTGQGNVAFPWPGGWPLPAAGGRRHVDAASPDHACFLQSRQKAKRNGPGWNRFASISDRSSRFVIPSAARNLLWRKSRSFASLRMTTCFAQDDKSLLHLYFCSRLFQFLLRGFGISLRHALFHRLRRTVDQVFGFLEA